LQTVRKNVLHDYCYCLEYFKRNAGFYAKQTSYPPMPFQAMPPEMYPPDMLFGEYFQNLIEGAKLPGILPTAQALAPTVNKGSSSTDFTPTTSFFPSTSPFTSCIFVPSKHCDSKWCPEVLQLKEEVATLKLE